MRAIIEYVNATQLTLNFQYIYNQHFFPHVDNMYKDVKNKHKKTWDDCGKKVKIFKHIKTLHNFTLCLIKYQWRLFVKINTSNIQLFIFPLL